MRDLGLLTLKQVFYVANVAEKQLGDARQRQATCGALRAHADAEGAPVVVICAAAEAEIAELDAGGAPGVPREPRASRSRA